MSQSLRLEYACTKAEMEEAQTLALHKQLGGGSKWRARVVLCFIVVVMLASICARLRYEFSDSNRPYVFVAIFIGIFLYFLWKQRRPRKVENNILEVSEENIALTASGSKTTMPWSAFSDCLESPRIFVLRDRPKKVLLVFPKRAFPSESWQDWFREVAHQRPGTIAPVSEAPAEFEAPTDGQVVLNFRLGLRDYLDRTLASWRTWSVIIGMLGFFAGMDIYFEMQPHPLGINSPLKTFIIMMCISVPMIPAMVISIFTLSHWRAHSKYLTLQEARLSERGMRLTGPDGENILGWSLFTSFKETKRCFILWNAKGGVWLLLPRRGFRSKEDWERCGEILGRNLRQTRWFWG